MMIERFSAGSASMIRLVHVMLHTKMNRKTTSSNKKKQDNLGSSRIGSDYRLTYTGSDQVGWDRIGSGPMVGSDPVGSEDTTSSKQRKQEQTNTKDLYITEARAFLHLLLWIASTLKQLGHPLVQLFDPVWGTRTKSRRR